MRDSSLPLSNLRARASGVADAAGRIHFVVLYGGPQQVYVDDAYRVFAHPVGTAAQIRFERKHPGWLIGTYAVWPRGKRLAGGLRRVITGDLRERMAELRRCAA